MEYEYNRITNIEIAYLFAKNMNHAVSKHQDWVLFEPSKFIYAFFSFNMLYDIDWEKTINELKISVHSERISTGDKIQHFTKFIHKHSENVYQELNLDYNQITRNSKNITGDKSIDRRNKYIIPIKTYLENYKDAIKNLSCYKRLNWEDHYRILSFCNQIRNNIFHGLKTITQMEMKDQRNRLLDYTHILLETMELFFNIINKTIDYQRQESYALNENIGL